MLEQGWLAWCDGTAAPNPGCIGVGVLLVAPDGSRHERSLRLGSGCNNEAEVRALLATWEVAAELGAFPLRVHCDSDFVVTAVNAADSAAPAPLGALLAQVLRQRPPGLELVWIPRHRNGDADRLARAALGLPPKPAKRKR
jgi:ribonuclease HI